MRPTSTVRSFSKLYGLAGLRIGYGISDIELADILDRARHPFNVSSLAQAAAQTGGAVIIGAPTNAFTDAFADLGLFESLMNMEFAE